MLLTFSAVELLLLTVMVWGALLEPIAVLANVSELGERLARCACAAGRARVKSATNTTGKQPANHGRKKLIATSLDEG